jgi:hypothetical protein
LLRPFFAGEAIGKGARGALTSPEASDLLRQELVDAAFGVKNLKIYPVHRRVLKDKLKLKP